MNSIQLTYIPSDKKYQSLQSLLNKDWAMMLDSGAGINKQAGKKASSYRRYDICVCSPSVRLTFEHDCLTIEKANEDKYLSHEKPLYAMRTLLAQYAKYAVASKGALSSQMKIPFNGGWLGYISYDFGREQEVPSQKQACSQKLSGDLQVPFIRMGLYQWALISDHIQQTTTMYNFGLSALDWQELKLEIIPMLNNNQIAQPGGQGSSHSAPSLISPFESDMSYQDYSDAFHKIKNYIHAGDCYQVNFAQRFTAKYKGSPLDLYAMLAKENNSPFSAYLNFSKQQIISLSPERFIESHQGKVTTQPIKGTLPRDIDPVKDKQLANQLLNSEKDKAENLMIVDLMRNDLSKTAAMASVRVTELFALYNFESVHHLISTIKSKLGSQFDNFDILATTLPGGSITGAPKIRAMQIIQELEPVKRGIYCGVIGYIDFKGNMDTNICIRTLIADKGHLYCWAGGGLVADSQLKLEYQETFDKLSKILPVLNRTVENNLGSD